MKEQKAYLLPLLAATLRRRLLEKPQDGSEISLRELASQLGYDRRTGSALLSAVLRGCIGDVSLDRMDDLRRRLDLPAQPPPSQKDGGLRAPGKPPAWVTQATANLRHLLSRRGVS